MALLVAAAFAGVLPVLASADSPVSLSAPWIDGDTSAVGNTLTAEQGTWSNSPTSFGYQWYRCDDPEEFVCAAIDGATDPTYTLVSADLGEYLYVTLTATNADGSASADSFLTGTVGAPEFSGPSYPHFTVNPGTLGVGGTLTVDPGDASGSPAFSYQWSRCDTDLNCDEIGGAVGASHVIANADLGKVLQVEISATNAYGESSWELQTEYAIGTPFNTSFPEIAGDVSAVGNTLTASKGSWINASSFSYQWSRCTGWSDCTTISAATASSYTVVEPDLGDMLEVSVTATNSVGSSTLIAGPTGVVGAPQPLTWPSFTTDTNSAGVGDTLTVDPGSWGGSPSLAYQWSRCTSDGGSCDPIDAATDASYQITDADLGHVLEVDVTATNAYGDSDASIETEFALGTPIVTVWPSISGDVSTVGGVLKLNQGTWKNVTSFSYEWRRCDLNWNCTTIAGATGATYRIRPLDLGHRLEAGATGTNTVGSTTGWATTGVVGAPVNLVAPQISGDTSTVGSTLTVTKGSWLNATVFTYSWLRCSTSCNTIDGATGAKYKLSSADLGDSVIASVTARNAAGSTSQTAWTSGRVGSPVNAVAPKISVKTTSLGTILTVTKGTWRNAASFAYQWYRCYSTCQAIDGATTSSHTVVGADYGQWLRVVVTASNTSGTTSVDAWSPAPVGMVTEPVLSASQNVTLGPKSKTPTPVVGNHLNVTSGSWTGSPTISYQWQRCALNYSSCSPIDGATTAGYTITSGDLGKIVEVVVSATGALGSGQDLESLWAAVGAPYTTANDGSITGTPRVGATLTAVNATSWGGATPVTFSYQWFRCGKTCSWISGATGQTYVAAAPDAGSSLQVTITASNDYGGGVGSLVYKTKPVKAVSAPKVTSFTPRRGAAGLSVKITGSHLADTTTVTFNGVEADFSIVSDTTVNATVPEGATSGPIAVYGLGGSSVSKTSFVIPVPPVIGSVTPLIGKVGGPVTITGSGFADASKVTFNGTAAKFMILSDSTITTTVPAAAATGPIEVTNQQDTAISSSDFVVLAAPTITTFDPPGGPAATSVIITGANFSFDPAANTVVKFGSVVADFTVDSETQITAVVPDGVLPGKITVSDVAGSATSKTVFQAVPVPVIKSFTPAKGAIGSTVTITGSYLASTSEVSFNGTDATIILATDKKVTVTVPDGASTGPITLTSVGGVATTTTVFIVPVPPVVDSLSTDLGKVGDSISIYGSGFADSSSVRFNGTAASFSIVSDAHITATVPNGATTGQLTVANPEGSDSSTSFIVVVAPAIVSFDPSSGGVGDSVTITGAGFTAVTSVTFNGTAADDFSVDSDTQITASVPAGATSGKIAVVNLAGNATSTASFTVLPPPTIDSFAPDTGFVGDTVVITGSNFTDATEVDFNGWQAVFTVDSDTQITATVPDGASTGLITVANAHGVSVSTGSFTVLGPPTIDSFTPASGSVGDTVTISGSNFTGATEVDFNGTPASAFTVDSDGQITTTVPDGATSGSIKVTGPNGSATSSGTFAILAAPVITSFTPAGGSSGDTVTISGSNFTGTTEVDFNGTPASEFTVDSDSQITVTVPDGATSGPITVINAVGSGPSESSFAIPDSPPP